VQWRGLERTRADKLVVANANANANADGQQLPHLPGCTDVQVTTVDLADEARCSHQSEAAVGTAAGDSAGEDR
jgi:hypothetical protein